MSENFIEVKNLSYKYGKHDPIIKNVNLEIKKGELITLLGPNGAGKSTLLNCIAGLNKPFEGDVLLEGKSIFSMSSKEIAQKVAYVPQISSSAYGYAVRDYIAMGRAAHLGMFFMPSKDDYKIVDDAMEMMGISRYAYKSYNQISGGERQMACICRAIVQNPQLIIFDEPTSALDYGNQLKILQIVNKLSKEGYAIIMTTHNPEHPILLGGRVAVISREGYMRSGTVNEIMKEDYLSEIYQTKLRLVYVEEMGRTVCMGESL